jgi:hypothetical protein
MYKTIAALLVATQAEKIPLTKRNLTVEQFQASKATLEKQVEHGFLTDRDNGSHVHLKDYMNTQYMAEVSLGTPPQKFPLIPDTGSSNVWVYSSKCNSIPCLYHKLFDGSKSSTYKADGEKFELHYGSGGVSGYQSYDTVRFGNTESTNFHFGEIMNVDGVAFLASDMCGILGLAYNSISMYGMPTYDDADNQTDKSFTFYLGTNPEESYITFPGTDAEKNAEWEFHPVIEERYYSIQFDKFGSVDMTGTKAVIDSGTSLIVGSQDQVDKILNGATVAQDCSDLDQLKDLDLVFNGKTYTLEPKDYVISITQGSETQCVMGIMGAQFPAGFDYMIVGDVFMRKFDTHFDKVNNQVGFSRK